MCRHFASALRVLSICGFIVGSGLVTSTRAWGQDAALPDDSGTAARGASPPAAAVASVPPGPARPSAAARQNDRSSAPLSDQPLPLGTNDAEGNLSLREVTERGIQLFRAGDYNGAVQAFTTAHILSPKPMFLFNIAQAQRKAGRPQEALISYQLFLKKAPDSPLRAETEAYLELVRTQLKIRAASEATSSPQLRGQVLATLAPLAAERRVPLHRRPWLWGLVGTAVAVTSGVAVGVYLGTRPPSTTLGTLEPIF